MTDQQYHMGHTNEELDRLERQGHFLLPQTRALFLRAGLREGMRVLDFGCGVGDVSLLAASLVGSTGEVFGIDLSPDAVGIARARAEARGLPNVRFHTGHEHAVDAILEGRKLDALVGRLVLIHQSDPVATVCHLASHLRPGGVIAFHEIETMARWWSSHPNHLLEQIWRWVAGLEARGVFQRDVGLQLKRAFVRLGIQDGLVIREGRVTLANDAEANDWLLRFAATIATPVQRMGLGSPEDRPLEDLIAELLADPASREAMNIPAYLTGATGTLPGA